MRNHKTNQKGFTLIELIVVIVLIGVMFSFALPRMEGYLFSDGTDRVSRWIVLNVANLKGMAVKDQTRYALNVDVANNAFWVSSEMMDETGIEEAKKNSFVLTDDVRIVDVVYPYEGKDDEEMSDILFYKKGYSDNAIIHMENNDNKRFSYVIEPFMPQVEIKEGFVLFDE